MKRRYFSGVIFAALMAFMLLFSSCVGDSPFSKTTSGGEDPKQNISIELGGEDPPLSSVGGSNSNNNTNDPSLSGDGPLSGDFTVYFIDVGQADSALVSCDGQHMLIDGGNVNDSSLLYTFLKNHEVSHLDYVIGTHGHEDHIGGIPGALNYATAGKVYCSVDKYDSKAFDNFLKTVSKQGLELTKPVPGETFEFGGAEVEILAPINLKAKDHNQLSIVLKITYGQTSFLFTADAGREAEQDILNAGYDIDCTVLKVGHHGSEASTTYPFLREVMPEYAVISVGKNNVYGHPTDIVLSRLSDAGVTFYRTDLNGTIVCTSDGETVTFTPEKGTATGEPDNGGAAAAGEITNPNTSTSPEGYLGNSNSKKFHIIDCKTGNTTGEKNRVYFSSREEAIRQGYDPAKCCNP